MVINCYKKIFILMILCNSYFMHAISAVMADRVSYVVASACFFANYRYIQKAPSTQIINPIFVVGGSLLATGISYLALHSITPEGRLKRADLLIQDLSRYQLARISFDDEDQFFDAVHDQHLREDLPLISAYNNLISVLPDVYLIFNLINKAAVEIGSDQLLQEKHKSLLMRVNKIFGNISVALKRIRGHKDYLSQLTIYKESLYNEKQTIAQEQIALAQQQMANAQQSSALLKWLKTLFQIGFR